MITFDRNNKIFSFFALVKRNIFAMLKNKLVIVVFMIGISLITAIFFLYIRPSETEYLINAAMNNGTEISVGNAKFAVDNWFVVNITIAAMLFAASALAMLVLSDRGNAINNDLRATPMNRASIDFAYIIGGCLVVICVGIFTLTIGLIFLAKSHELIMRSIDILGAIITLPFSALTITAFVHLFAKITRKANIYLVISGVILLFLSYLSGLIIPINRFPQWMIYLCNILPTTQSSLLLKHYFLDYALYQSPIKIAYSFKIILMNRLAVNNLYSMFNYKWYYSLYVVIAYSLLLPLISILINVSVDKINLYLLHRRNKNLI